MSSKFSAPELTDRYTIERELGAGASGVVSLVKNKAEGVYYVCKAMDTSTFDQKDVQHAMGEVSVLASLNHPNITAHKESFVAGTFLYIIMEYADGGDLEDAIKAQRTTGTYFEEEVVLNWFVQLCLALKHVHDRKILHRDLKTQNVMLTKDRKIKLGDFGLTAVLKNTVGKAETRLGTPYYMSPELCQSQPYNAKNDIWALGCILYKMASLRHAFLAKSFNELVKKIVTQPTPKVPKGFSKSTQKLVNALLQKNPDDRPSINQLLKVSFLKKRTQSLLSSDVYKEEFSHTTIHTDLANVPADSDSGSDSYTESEVSDGAEEDFQEQPPLTINQEDERAFNVLKEKYISMGIGHENTGTKAKGSTDDIQDVKALREKYLAAQKAKKEKK